MRCLRFFYLHPLGKGIKEYAILNRWGNFTSKEIKALIQWLLSSCLPSCSTAQLDRCDTSVAQECFGQKKKKRERVNKTFIIMHVLEHANPIIWYRMPFPY